MEFMLSYQLYSSGQKSKKKRVSDAVNGCIDYYYLDIWETSKDSNMAEVEIEVEEKV